MQEIISEKLKKNKINGSRKEGKGRRKKGRTWVMKKEKKKSEGIAVD